jgi:hypothetical protein
VEFKIQIISIIKMFIILLSAEWEIPGKLPVSTVSSKDYCEDTRKTQNLE